MLQSTLSVDSVGNSAARPIVAYRPNRKRKGVTIMSEQNAAGTVELTPQEIALQAAKVKAEETNKTRTGKGTRVRVGQTRGRNVQVVSWEAFDDSQPDTLPASLQEFMELTKTTEEKVLVTYLIDGYNDAQYTAASDPIAEFINPEWEEETQKQFRIVIRNYAANTGETLEASVALIKPNIEKAFLARKAAAAAK